MPKNEQKALLLHKENFVVPKGQGHLVHYKIAKQTASGDFLEKVRLVVSGAKTFDGGVKRNLELQGYLVEILYHPHGTYSNVQIVDKDNEIEQMRRQIAELSAKSNENPSLAEEAIRRLKEELKAQTEENKKLKKSLKEFEKGGKE